MALELVIQQQDAHPMPLSEEEVEVLGQQLLLK
jgi:hypothetical protein